MQIHGAAGFGKKSSIFLLFLMVGLLMFLLNTPAVFASQTSIYNSLKHGGANSPNGQYETPKQPTVYLTFDDGPSRLTPRVLDILKKENIKATFFVLGSLAQKQPELVKRIVKEGHSIGNHTYDHVYSELYASFDEFWRQTRQTDDILKKIIGKRPQLLRAPGGTAGNFDDFYFYYLHQAGYRVFDWSMDSGDSRRVNVPASEMMSTVKKGPFPHEIQLLLHDGAGHASSVEALPDIIHFFQKKGYSFAALTEKVKPVQFKPRSTKWNRPVPTERQFNEEVAKAAARLELLQAEGQSAGLGEKKEAADPAADLNRPKPPLRISAESRTLALNDNGYMVREGRLYIPIKAAAKLMGGSVAWDAPDRTAVYFFGDRTIAYDLAHHELRLYQPDRPPQVSRMANMEVVSGTLYVPLRYIAGLAGNTVDRFSIGKELNTVDLTINRHAVPSRLTRNWTYQALLETVNLPKNSQQIAFS